MVMVRFYFVAFFHSAPSYSKVSLPQMSTMHFFLALYNAYTQVKEYVHHIPFRSSFFNRKKYSFLLHAIENNDLPKQNGRALCITVLSSGGLTLLQLWALSFLVYWSMNGSKLHVNDHNHIVHAMFNFLDNFKRTINNQIFAFQTWNIMINHHFQEKCKVFGIKNWLAFMLYILK